MITKTLVYFWFLHTLNLNSICFYGYWIWTHLKDLKLFYADKPSTLSHPWYCKCTGVFKNSYHESMTPFTTSYIDITLLYFTFRSYSTSSVRIYAWRASIGLWHRMLWFPELDSISPQLTPHEPWTEPSDNVFFLFWNICYFNQNGCSGTPVTGAIRLCIVQKEFYSEKCILSVFLNQQECGVRALRNYLFGFEVHENFKCSFIKSTEMYWYGIDNNFIPQNRNNFLGNPI